MTAPVAVPSSRRRRTYLVGGLALLVIAVLGVTIGPVRIGAGAALTELANRLLPASLPLSAISIMMPGWDIGGSARSPKRSSISLEKT